MLEECQNLEEEVIKRHGIVLTGARRIGLGPAGQARQAVRLASMEAIPKGEQGCAMLQQ